METIFAPLTIKGNCSVYLIRISGTLVKNCLLELGIRKKLEHKKATVCHLQDKNNKLLDEALITYFQAPNSFTGEDICEINLHCSNYIINSVFKILSSINNVRIAENGEFSKRAFLNNKLDLTQAEAIVDLIHSETELQHKQAMKQLQGENSKFFTNLRESIINILSNIEAIIDFPEDDIDINLINLLENKINMIIEVIKNILNDNNVGQKIKNGLHISIIGEPNVGKSSLLNYLAKKDLAIVSNIAGTTRDIIEVSIDIAGLPVIISDTAGIRETNNSIEKEGIKRALKNIENADLKILLINSEKININDKIKKLIDKNTIILLNKIDLKSKQKTEKIYELIDKNNVYNVLEVSIRNNINMNLLIDEIKGFIEKNITPFSNTNITQERHKIELLNAVNYLTNINFNMPIEIIAENIRLASVSIGKITGHINTEEILNNIFSKFCIGK